MNKKLILALMFVFSLSLVSAINFEGEEHIIYAEEGIIYHQIGNETNVLYEYGENNSNPKVLEFDERLYIAWQGWAEFPPAPPGETFEIPQYMLYYKSYANGVLSPKDIIYQKFSYDNLDANLTLVEEDGRLYARFYDYVNEESKEVTIIQLEKVKIEKNESLNKTTLTFRESNKVIEVFNVDVLEVEDKTVTTKKIELKLEGNGTEEVKLNLTDFGKPYFVYVDGVQTTFSFTNNILVFTAHFSIKDVTVDYNAPVVTPSSGGSSGGSSSYVCTTKWSCTEWSECIDDEQVRSCGIEVGKCIPKTEQPEKVRVCIVENVISVNDNQDDKTNDNQDDKTFPIVLILGIVCIVVGIVFVTKYVTKTK